MRLLSLSRFECGISTPPSSFDSSYLFFIISVQSLLKGVGLNGPIHNVRVQWDSQAGSCKEKGE